MNKHYAKELRTLAELGIITLFFIETDAFMFFIYWTVLSLIVAVPFLAMGSSFMISSILMLILVVIFHHVFKDHKTFLDILVNCTGSAILADIIMFVVALL